MHARPSSRFSVVTTVGALVAMGAVAWAARLLVDAGTFDRVWTNHPAMTCTVHKGLPGVEDIVRVPGTTKVFLTTHTRGLREGEVFSSGLFSYDVATPSVAPIAVPMPEGKRFALHGVGYFADGFAAGTALTQPIFSGFLHLVNHSDEAADTIEQFRVEGDKVTHLRSRTLPGIRTANSVAPIGEDAFYFTTDFGSTSVLMQTFEKFLRIPRGAVYFSNGGETKQVASALQFGNGIVLSPNGQKLYVAEMLARRIRIYNIDHTTATLQESKSLFIDTAPDNLRLDDKGALYVAAHPRLLDLNAHSKAPWKARAPAQVLRLRDVEGDTEMEEVLSDTGINLAAVSTALPIGNHLLMGTIYSDGLYDCVLRTGEIR